MPELIIFFTQWELAITLNNKLKGMQNIPGEKYPCLCSIAKLFSHLNFNYFMALHFRSLPLDQKDPNNVAIH